MIRHPFKKFRAALLPIIALLALLIGLPSFSEAELTIGAVPGASRELATAAKIERLGRYFSQRLGEPVSVRLLKDEQTLHAWLYRFRALDLAVFSLDFANRQPASQLDRLLTLYPDRAGTGLVFGVRRGFAGSARQKLLDVLQVIDTDLQTAGLEVVPPQRKKTPVRTRRLTPKTKANAPPPATQPPEPKPIPAAKTIKTTATEPALPVAQKVAARPQQIKKPHPDTPRLMSQIPVRKVDRPEPAPAVEPSTQNRARPAKPAGNAGNEIRSEVPVPHVATSRPTESVSPVKRENRSAYSRDARPFQTETASDDNSNLLRYLLGITIILGLGSLIKLVLLSNRRHRPTAGGRKSALLINHDWSELAARTDERQTTKREPPAAEKKDVPQRRPKPTVEKTLSEPADAVLSRSVEKPTATETGLAGPAKERAPAIQATIDTTTAEDQARLQGELGSDQLPDLFQHIASAGRTGTLVVLSEHHEKRIVFHDGLISAASSIDLKSRNQTGFLMNKLGYLLVRQNKISDNQRDQALVMCESNRSLRLGEALLQLGALTLTSLKESLAEQAKMVLSSLLVFPEGHFNFEALTRNIEPQERLQLSVPEFLHEAAGHEAEWQGIRDVIPSLETVLGFTETGKEKLNSGKMTVHQRYILSLIDGQKPIREICHSATMLDYEVYHFLYMMVNATILHALPA